MRSRGRAWLETACVLSLLAAPASAKVDVRTRLACPSEVDPRAMAAIEVTLENQECIPRPVRLLSSFAANTGGGLGGVYGPTHMFETVVPAANCLTFTPAIVQFSPLNAPPAVPDSLGGTLAGYVVISEWSGGQKTETHHCLITVPEPSVVTQLVSSVLGLGALSALRRRRA